VTFSLLSVVIVALPTSIMCRLIRFLSRLCCTTSYVVGRCGREGAESGDEWAATWTGVKRINDGQSAIAFVELALRFYLRKLSGIAFAIAIAF